MCAICTVRITSPPPPPPPPALVAGTTKPAIDRATVLKPLLLLVLMLLLLLLLLASDCGGSRGNGVGGIEGGADIDVDGDIIDGGGDITTSVGAWRLDVCAVDLKTMKMINKRCQ